MGRRVLVADDTGFQRRLLETVLATRHDVVATAENGVEAVEQVGNHEPDAVVLDAVLPIQDGIDAAAAIREKAPATTIVVTVARDVDERAAEAREAGADAVVAKPFQREAILGAVAGE